MGRVQRDRDLVAGGCVCGERGTGALIGNRRMAGVGLVHPVNVAVLSQKIALDILDVCAKLITKLALSVQPPKRWEDQEFGVSIRVSTAADGDPARIVADNDFNLTWYDFPFTDNTLLADGTRFSMVIETVDADAHLAKFKLVWFPHDYFSERERPTNHREFRKKLGLQIAG